MTFFSSSSSSSSSNILLLLPFLLLFSVGIVTKTDLVKAYNAGLLLDRPVKEIMTTEDLLATCTEHMSRDEAAKILEHNQNHHAIVIDPETKNFRGLLSSWDITVECAKDDRAVSPVLLVLGIACGSWMVTAASSLCSLPCLLFFSILVPCSYYLYLYLYYVIVALEPKRRRKVSQA